MLLVEICFEPSFFVSFLLIVSEVERTPHLSHEQRERNATIPIASLAFTEVERTLHPGTERAGASSWLPRDDCAPRPHVRNNL